MLGWLARRREFQRLADAEATRLVVSEGGAGYYTARQIARLARESGDHRAARLWGRVARQVAKRTGLVPGHSKIGRSRSGRSVLEVVLGRQPVECVLGISIGFQRQLDLVCRHDDATEMADERSCEPGLFERDTDGTGFQSVQHAESDLPVPTPSFDSAQALAGRSAIKAEFDLVRPSGRLHLLLLRTTASRP